MQLGLAEPRIDFAPFERRLSTNDAAPVAIALSGGGDSLALLLAAERWAARAGRRLLALTVDHGLQPDGARWAHWAGQRARRLGIQHRTLRWDGDKPVAGLPAAARAARHRLLAEAARAAGARVILLGHTADDCLEAAAMRATGSTTPTPREWSPSPVWPEGRGIFLFRPLLSLRRADLRAWLADEGEDWIDDPANDDPRYARARARRTLADDPARLACDLEPVGADAHDIAFGSAGECRLARDKLTGLGVREQRRWLSALLLCASGGDTPPRAAQLDRLAEQLASVDDITAVLAGARIEARGDRLLVCREAGEFRRGGPSEACLSVGETVFDGRFLLIAAEPGWTVRPLRGVAKTLSAAERRGLAGLPAAVRGALPVVTGPDGTCFCPVLAQDRPILAFALGAERLAAALGAIQNEASIERVAKPSTGA